MEGDSDGCRRSEPYRPFRRGFRYRIRSWGVEMIHYFAGNSIGMKGTKIDE